MSSEAPYISRAKDTQAHPTLLDKSARYKRRMKARKTVKAQRKAVEHDSRAVKFHF